MDTFFKTEVLDLIERAKEQLGSYNKVSTKVGVSNGTISQMVNGNHDLIKPELWQKVAAALNWTPKAWNIAETTNYKMLTQLFTDAKTESMFMAVSHAAGSGKSASINKYAETDSSVYVVCAGEWSRRLFLLNLSRSLGIDTGKGYANVEELGKKVVTFFVERQTLKPLLILDEADKLKPSALRFLIPFYNELEDKAGVVIAGTDNLEKEIKRGVRYQTKGYDEIDSRFGRKFVHLFGATKKDVAAICTVNGITDAQMHEAIFDEAEPTMRTHEGKKYRVIDDLRRVKRIVKRERLKLQRANAH